MADRDKKKALFRAKLNQKLHTTRIDSPLVRYNDFGKPVCRVCDVVFKSDSDWIPHQASRKHHQAINNLKATASKNNATKSETINVFPKQQGDDINAEDHSIPKLSQPSSQLPADFFDHGDTKQQKVVSAQLQDVDTSVGAVPSRPSNSGRHEFEPARSSENVTGAPGANQIKGELPEGFFDNKDADLRARGIEPVKPDVKDEYKEFEKLIQEDLAEVDNRFEEEEIDAAEHIEEEEIVEQRTYKNRVEELKRKKLELLASRPSKGSKISVASGSKVEQDDTSSEDEESFAVDWRAQHL